MRSGSIADEYNFSYQSAQRAGLSQATACLSGSQMLNSRFFSVKIAAEARGIIGYTG